jgi:hypothetical protein
MRQHEMPPTSGSRYSLHTQNPERAFWYTFLRSHNWSPVSSVPLQSMSPIPSAPVHSKGTGYKKKLHSTSYVTKHSDTHLNDASPLGVRRIYGDSHHAIPKDAVQFGANSVEKSQLNNTLAANSIDVAPVNEPLFTVQHAAPVNANLVFSRQTGRQLSRRQSTWHQLTRRHPTRREPRRRLHTTSASPSNAKPLDVKTFDVKPVDANAYDSKAPQ